MPYPNEHAARIANPDKFDKIRRQNDKFGAGIDVIWGVNKDGSTEIQAIRFDKRKFSPSQAQAWLKKHGYSPIEFAAASKEGNDVSEDEKRMYEEDECAVEYGIGATSFAELEKLRDTQDMMFSMQKMTDDFTMLSREIMKSPMIADKQAALQNLSAEFADRIANAEETKGDEWEILTDEVFLDLFSGVKEYDEKFTGSPRNKYGTHASKGYRGGRDAWKRAWRIHFSKVRSQGPLQGTVRRVSMIAQGMKPVCNLPEMSAASVGPRSGKEGPLDGEYLQTAKDYGMSSWANPKDDGLSREDIQLTCQDLEDIKRAALQEIAKRQQARGQEPSGQKGILETVKGWFDELKMALGIKKEQPIPQAIKTFTAKDGKTWIVVWSTNAFKDRDEEMFQTKAIEDFVERHAGDETKGEIWFWHLPKSKFADIKLQSVVGRFLVEAGPFDDTFVGQAFKDFFEQNPFGHPELAPDGWGASHGFKYNSADREDGVFEWFEKHESSVLPADKAANPYNPGFILNKEETIVDDETRKKWESALGADLVSEIVEVGETKTAELEQTVEFKETKDEPEDKPTEEPTAEQKEDETGEQPEQQPEREDVEEPEQTEKAITREEIAEAMKLLMDGLREDLKGIAKEIVQAEISETVDNLTELIAPIAQKVASLSQDDETKIANAVPEVPTASLASMVESRLFSDKAVVDGRTKYGKDKPQETNPATGKYPNVQGVELKLWKDKEAE